LNNSFASNFSALNKLRKISGKNKKYSTKQWNQYKKRDSENSEPQLCSSIVNQIIVTGS